MDLIWIPCGCAKVVGEEEDEEEEKEASVERECEVLRRSCGPVRRGKRATCEEDGDDDDSESCVVLGVKEEERRL